MNNIKEYWYSYNWYFNNNFILVGNFLLWLLKSKNNKSISDFFGNRNVPWYTSMLSIVATETSVLTFISVPGISYRGDWTFIQLALGYILGRVLVSFFLLPVFLNMELLLFMKYLKNT